MYFLVLNIILMTYIIAFPSNNFTKNPKRTTISNGGEPNLLTSPNQFIHQMKSIDGLNFALVNKTGLGTSINQSKSEVQVYLTFLPLKVLCSQSEAVRPH
jgi:hypothetical protein